MSVPLNADLTRGMSEACYASLTGKNAPGATVALIVDGRMTAIGVGHRDLDRLHPLSSDAQFYLYSITKVLLATAALRLVEQGRVTLDDPLLGILPELPEEPPTSLRQLLNHTAGIPDYGGSPGYNRDLRADPGTPWTQDEFLDRTLALGLIFPPGAGWAYSNVGYMLVKRVIERLMGMSLRAALELMVFGPLGLGQTHVAETLADGRMLTPGYSGALDAGDEVHDIAGRYHPGWVSHGVVISTAAETARLIDALFAGRLLTDRSLEAMLTVVAVPGSFPPFVRPAYGLGLMVDPESRYGRVAGHAGGGPGYATAAFHFPDVQGQRVTAVALVNCDWAGVELEIVFALAEIARRLPLNA